MNKGKTLSPRGCGGGMKTETLKKCESRGIAQCPSPGIACFFSRSYAVLLSE